MLVRRRKKSFSIRSIDVFCLSLSLSLGHYTSTVYDAKGDAWWTYDDTSVTSCTEERVLTNLAPDAYGVMYMHQYVFDC